eukprot:m.168311 g.168311  ORF g.168311 m.168311 type:complete len:77 (-) comp15315_c2_seq4:3082-3312(-)
MGLLFNIKCRGIYRDNHPMKMNEQKRFTFKLLVYFQESIVFHDKTLTKIFIHSLVVGCHKKVTSIFYFFLTKYFAL